MRERPEVSLPAAFAGLTRSEDSLFLFLLAGDAVTRPRHGFEPFLLQLRMTTDAFAEFFLLNSIECIFDQPEERASVVRLAEEKFFCVGIRSLIGEIHRGILVRFAPFLLGPRDCFQELFAPRLKFLFVIVEPLLIHILLSNPAFQSRFLGEPKRATQIR